jgi:hypothetical protein
MVIDCTLNELKVPGFSGVNPPFGTKKPGGESVTAREADVNIRLPFSRQRPYHVGEDSVTSEVEAHSVFVLEMPGITLALGNGAFTGCAARIFNAADADVTVAYGSDASETVEPGGYRDLTWRNGAWTLPPKATDSAAGLMSAADKAKTDKLVINAHADMVDGAGRDLRLVFGISSTDPAVYIPQIMAQIRARCNGTGTPDFTGIEIGDYIDGLDLSTIPAENSGTAGQAWSDTYKNNRIVISGFNTYKGMGDTENTKNHILFTFRNIPLKKRMNASNDNAGGYIVSELRAFLEGTAGDGTGDKSGVTTAAFTKALKAQMGDYLYTIKKCHSTKSGIAWAQYTVWPVSEIETFGVPAYGDEGVQMAAISSPSIAARAGAIAPIHIPLYQKSYEYRAKRYNGAREWHFLQTPYAPGTSSFCHGNYSGQAGSSPAGSVGGCAPAFCVA